MSQILSYVAIYDTFTLVRNLMLITSDLPEHIVSDASSYAAKNGLTFDKLVIEALIQYILAKNSDESLLLLAIQRAAQLPAGHEFTVKQLMSDMWDNIESPKSFGREFKKKVINAQIASEKGKNSSNQSIYVTYASAAKQAMQFTAPTGW